VLFDADCRLCRATVAFLIRHERAPNLMFCPLQSPAARQIAGDGPNTAAPEGTLILADSGRLRVRSDAVLEAARHLRAPWRWVRLTAVLPRRWRDRLYGWIARNRMRWFGRPSADDRLDALIKRFPARFLPDR